MPLKETHGFTPVIFAIFGNGFVTIIKFVAAFASGSSSMLSEAVHSVADTLNQIFLLVGLKKSLKKADSQFEYGYGNERFFWGLVSALGIFFIGAGITAYNGLSSLAHPEHIDFSPILFITLAVAFLVELFTLRVAYQELVRNFPNMSFRERIRESDSATLAVLLEDSVAILGVIVASVSILLSYYLNNPLWDAIGSLIIASLLASVAIALVVKNRSYLLGRAMPDELRAEVIAYLKTEPSIEKIIDFKSSTLGLGMYRIKCEVEFNGGALLREAHRGDDMRNQFEEVNNDFEEFKKFLAEYSDRIPRLMGKRIDKIEKEIRERFPSIKNIDIEIN
ncbi:cation diffusion facilitator family transporter [Patescibacteria group bacterium]|nr:MAG: cation diffusion facilitator family transporter [Patescibacteria group bacterium]